MSAATAKPLLRASSLRDCPRKAVFEAIGAPARERTPKEDGTLWRGKSIGRDYTIFLATQMATKIYVESGAHHWVPPELRAKSIDTAGVIAEQRIRWPAGVGHCDAFIPETRTVVEVLSSAHASEEMRHSKLLQAVIYTEHHPQAENCALVIVSSVVNVFDETINSVSAGSRSITASAKSVPSTFDTKRNVISRWL